MISLKNLQGIPAGEPLLADDVLELHAARLILLVRCCGIKNQGKTTYRIDGLTKMAKLDFFVRYPKFFTDVCRSLGIPAQRPADSIESTMVRFHYGPWDRRYYHILGYLEGRRLLAITPAGASGFIISLTDEGAALANRLIADDSFTSVQQQMARVKTVLGSKSGTFLKNLIYKEFEDEIVRRKLGEVIR